MKRLFLYRIFFFLLFFIFPFFSIAQQTKVDSLLLFLKTAPDDTVKVNTLNALCREYRNISSFGPALYYAQQAKALAEKIQILGEKAKGWPKGIANSLANMGIISFNHGNFKVAADFHFQALKIREKIGDKIGIGNSCNSIALSYSNLGDIEKALEYHFKSLKIMEEIGNKNGIGNSYNNIGLLYYDEGNYDQALKYLYKALKIGEELNERLYMSGRYNNIGIVYEQQGRLSNKTMANDKFQKALAYHLKSLNIQEELGDTQGKGGSYNNIALIYFDLGKIALNKDVSKKYYKNSLENYLKALLIAKEINDQDLMCNTSINIANVYLESNKLEEAHDYLNQTLKLAKEIGKKSRVQEAYFSLSELFERKHDYKQALEYHKLYTNLKDTLLNETSSKQIAEMNTKYDTERKDKELIQKDAEIIKQQAESEKQQTQRNAFIIGFGLVLVLAFFIFRGYRQKKEANAMLETKNEAISKQNKEIEKKNTVITDSIEYAKNIQSSILPTEEELKKHFQNYFILYKPKDIVSGDFYWINEQENNLLFAVADCTGHGVPGAFMSLMGHNLLREIVSRKNNFNPSEILDELNLKVLKTLKQDSKNTSAKYGMDIALISMDKKRNRIEFAGAHNPLYIIRNKECIQLKAEARSIGSFPREDKKGFMNQSFQLQKGDMLYLFSDGYTDQKGGPDGKKLFSKPFRELLQDLCELNVSEQHWQLDTNIINWQGNKKQTDDILVVGIRM
ncbi:MAG: tetratricopeptide repeat protein [Bacteroidetes bacterium]|nr:tetratricopeptide repeat protein [Bacteroidota bacterium]